MVKTYFSIAIYDAFETFEYKYSKNFEAECLYIEDNNKKIIIPLVYKLNNFFNKKHKLKKLVQNNILNLNILIKLFHRDFQKLKRNKIILLFVFTVNSLKILKKMKIKKILFPDYPYLYVKFSLFIPDKRINNIDRLKENDKILKIKKYFSRRNKITLEFSGNKYKYLNIDANIIPLILKYKYNNKFDRMIYFFLKLLKLSLKNVKKIDELNINYIGEIDYLNTYKHNIKFMGPVIYINEVITSPRISGILKIFHTKKLRLNLDNKFFEKNEEIYFDKGSYNEFVLSGNLQKEKIKIRGIYYIKNLIIDKNFNFKEGLNVNIATTYPLCNIINNNKKLLKFKITSLMDSYYDEDFKKNFQEIIKKFLFKKYIELIQKQNIILDCIIGIDEIIYEHKNLLKKIKKDFLDLINKKFQDLNKSKNKNVIVKLNKNENYYELKYYNNLLFSI